MGAISRVWGRGWPGVTLCLLCSGIGLLGCKLSTPNGFLDPTPDSNELLKTMNVRNNGELWSGVVAGDLPADVASVEVRFDDGVWKKAEITGKRWRVFIPAGPVAAADKSRWQIGSNHSLDVRARNASGNSGHHLTLTVRRMKNADLNADGFSDLVVTATGAGGGAGKVYLFYGSSAGFGIQNAAGAHSILSGENATDALGNAAALCDLDGDGYADVSVGSENALSQQGKVYLIAGREAKLQSAILPANAVILTGEAGLDKFGGRIGAGDLNGDGYCDLAVSASGFPGGLNAGKLYIFTGSLNGIGAQSASSAPAKISGDQNGDSLGSSVLVADLNADGFAEVAVGAFGYSAGANFGRVYVFQSESPTGISTQSAMSATSTYSGSSGTDRLGLELNAGFFSNGLKKDLIARGSLSGSPGGIYLFSSPTIPNVVKAISEANVSAIGGGSNDRLGASIAVADLDGDGLQELISGADGASGGLSRGRAYVLAMRTSVTTSNSLPYVLGEANNDRFGSAVSVADYNGDGCADVAVAASAFPAGANQGRVYVFHGRPGYLPAPATQATGAHGIITGEAAPDKFGQFIGQ